MNKRHIGIIGQPVHPTREEIRAELKKLFDTNKQDNPKPKKKKEGRKM